MKRDMEDLLSTCLDDLEQGDTVQAILSRYPEQSEELRPFLETAAQISQLASQPTVAAQQNSQALFLAQAAALSSPQAAPIPLWVTLRRLLVPVASLAVVLLFLGFGLISTSTTALPGDNLYPIKRSIENLRMMRASDSEQILDLSSQFQQERLREISMLLLSGREADVIFEGQIEAIDAASWVVEGLTVQINSGTIIDGSPQVGEIARVDGYTSAGSLYANQISVITGRPDPDVIPLPTVPPTETPTEEPTAKPTETPVKATPTEPVEVPVTEPVEVTPTSTPSPTPTATLEVAPTETPPPPPTATAVTLPPTSPPDDNDNDGDGGSGDQNDNGDDGSNDNGDDNSNDNGDDNDNDSDDNSNDNGDDNSNDNGDDDNSNDNGDDNDNDGDDDNSNDNGNDNDGNEDNSNDNGNDNDNDGDDHEENISS